MQHPFYVERRRGVYAHLVPGLCVTQPDVSVGSARALSTRYPGLALRAAMVVAAVFAATLVACSSPDAAEPVAEPLTSLPADVAAAHTEDAALAMVGGDEPDSHSAADNSDGSDPMESAAGGGDESADAPAGDESFPDAPSICAQLQEPVAKTLGLPLTRIESKAADVRNEIWGVTLDGCQLYAEAGGRELAIDANHQDLPAFRLRRLFRNFGWRENLEYQAVSPGESSAGFERWNGLCLVNVAFSPPAGAPCPKSDPVTCGRSPLELDYRIAVRCAIP